MFILDIDGTIKNGSAGIAGVAESVHRLLMDDSKKILFYTNGGYCSLTVTWEGVVKRIREDLSAEKFAEIEAKLTKSVVYNTAQLTGRYLKKNLEP